jgi:uncharacterized protein YdaU (DUF1376 family)
VAKKDKLLAEWFWTDRWTGSSAFLLPMEPRGLYREMLTQAWRRGGKLPNDPEAIRRAVGCTPSEWRRCWPKVEPYWRVDGDGLVNETQTDVIADAIAAHERAVKRGRKGGLGKAAKLLEQAERKHKNKQRQTTAQVQLEHKPPSLSPLVSPLERSPTDCAAAEGEEQRNCEIRAFLARFCELYSKYRFGAKYVVKRERDVPIVKQLLGVYGRERLEKLAQILVRTDDEWICQTDRGIGILSTKASWLDSLLAEREAQKAKQPA